MDLFILKYKLKIRIKSNKPRKIIKGRSKTWTHNRYLPSPNWPSLHRPRTWETKRRAFSNSSTRYRRKMSTPKLVFPIFATRYVLCANVEVSSYSKISVPQNQYWMFHPGGWQKVQIVLPLKGKTADHSWVIHTFSTWLKTSRLQHCRYLWHCVRRQYTLPFQ